MRGDIITISKEWLLHKIIEFLILIYDCKKETTYTDDRCLYAEDLSYVTGWLKALEVSNDTNEVINDILSSKTDKYFDYWRQGKWGEKELRGLKELRSAIKKELPEN